MPIRASFGEFDGLEAMIPWLGFTALAVLLGTAGIVIGGRFKARARLAVGLGAAATVLELLGIARVLTDPWWRRRFQHDHGPDSVFCAISILALGIGLTALYLGWRRLDIHEKRGKPPERWEV